MDAALVLLLGLQALAGHAQLTPSGISPAVSGGLPTASAGPPTISGSFPTTSAGPPTASASLLTVSVSFSTVSSTSGGFLSSPQTLAPTISGSTSGTVSTSSGGISVAQSISEELFSLACSSGWGFLCSTTVPGTAPAVPGTPTSSGAVSGGSTPTTAGAATTSPGLSIPTSPKPQEKGSVPDWAIVLITLTVVAAIVGLLCGIKKACQLWKELSMGCGCGSVTPYSCHREAPRQRYSIK